MKPNFVQAKLDFINEYLGTDYRNLPEAEAKFFEVLEQTGGGGGGGPINTDFLPEGTTNLYYTNARVQAALSGYASLTSPQFVGNPTGPTKATTDDSNALATTAYVKAVVAQSGGGGGPANTDALPEGTTNLYYTASRAQGALAATVSGLNTAIDGKAPLVHTHPLSALTQSGATTGQVPAWDGEEWTPVDMTGGGEGLVISKSVPPGTIVYGYWTTPPADYLAANGTAVSRTTYSVLWNAMGNPNTGDGFSTFTLPDLRGEFVRGLDSGRGVDVSRVLGSSQVSQNLSHTHTNTVGTAGNHTHTVTIDQAGSHTHVYPDSSGSAGDINTQAGSDRPTFAFNFVNRNTESGGLHTHTNTVSTTGNHVHTVAIDSSGGTESRPRNIALLACIKYTAASESSGSIEPGPSDTDELPEGSVNLYYTDARAQAANSSALALKANTSDVNSALALKADQSALTSGLAGKANTSHTHTLSDLLQSGATTGQAAIWNGSAWTATTIAEAGIPYDPFIKNTAVTGTLNLVANTTTVFDLTLTGNSTLTVTTPTPPSGKQTTIVVRIRQGATAYTLSWFSGITWLTTGGTAPAAPAISKITEYIFTYDATNGWIGRVGATNT